ncbi:hypothetical protein [Rhodopseudomonas palustris]|uniref:hypothetical protein n=1 Tax=Rhodopseudomonas palustris TaxID=1076 RepID=UPI000D1BFD34|nr:hypothetical protein [Rhodopseudomonas palustris]
MKYKFTAENDEGFAFFERTLTSDQAASLVIGILAQEDEKATLEDKVGLVREVADGLAREFSGEILKPAPTKKKPAKTKKAATPPRHEGKPLHT